MTIARCPTSAGPYLLDEQPGQIACPKLAIDRKIEQSQLPRCWLTSGAWFYSPNFRKLQGRLVSGHLALVPRHAQTGGGICISMTFAFPVVASRPSQTARGQRESRLHSRTETVPLPATSGISARTVIDRCKVNLRIVLRPRCAHRSEPQNPPPPATPTRSHLSPFARTAPMANSTAAPASKHAALTTVATDQD